MSFKNKYILVTGASSGIGYAIAQQFLAANAYVGLHYNQSRDGVKRLLQSGQESRACVLQADFSSWDAVEKLSRNFLEWSGGKIDVLVNNAGEASRPAPVDQIDEAGWDQTFNINLKAPFLLSRAFLPQMQKQNSGSIINISSIGIKFGGGLNTVHYSASKAALELLTRIFAKAGAADNVRVNAIRAGVTKTPFHEKIGRSDLASRTKLIPMKRAAEPSEIADAVLYLASDKSTYINGTVLDVAGGE